MAADEDSRALQLERITVTEEDNVSPEPKLFCITCQNPTKDPHFLAVRLLFFTQQPPKPLN